MDPTRLVDVPGAMNRDRAGWNPIFRNPSEKIAREAKTLSFYRALLLPCQERCGTLKLPPIRALRSPATPPSLPMEPAVDPFHPLLRILDRYRADVHHLRPAAPERTIDDPLGPPIPQSLRTFLVRWNGAVLFRGVLRIRAVVDIASASREAPNVWLFADGPKDELWGYAAVSGGWHFGRWDGKRAGNEYFRGRGTDCGHRLGFDCVYLGWPTSAHVAYQPDGVRPTRCSRLCRRANCRGLSVEPYLH